MNKQEKVINGMECCIKRMTTTGECGYDCSYCHNPLGCKVVMLKDAISLMKAQEPRVMTLQDWEADHVAKMPVWVEWRESAKGECADYGKADGWAVLNVDEFIDVVYFGGRCWTSRPTDEQREVTPWTEPPKEG